MLCFNGFNKGAARKGPGLSAGFVRRGFAANIYIVWLARSNVARSVCREHNFYPFKGSAFGWEGRSSTSVMGNFINGW